MTAPDPLREDEVEAPRSLYGPDGTLARFTRACNKIHGIAEKLREQRRTSADAQIEAVAEALAQRFIDRGNARVIGSSYQCVADMPESYMRDFRNDARAAIIRLDELRGK